MEQVPKFPYRIEKITMKQVVSELDILLERIATENIGFAFIDEQSGKTCFLIPVAEGMENANWRLGKNDLYANDEKGDEYLL